MAGPDEVAGLCTSPQSSRGACGSPGYFCYVVFSEAALLILKQRCLRIFCAIKVMLSVFNHLNLQFLGTVPLLSVSERSWSSLLVHQVLLAGVYFVKKASTMLFGKQVNRKKCHESHYFLVSK